MNRDDIIRMAREAGLPIFDAAAVANNPAEQAMADIVTKVWHDSAERFAALVEQEFKERLAQAIEQLPFGDTAQSFATYVREFK